MLVPNPPAPTAPTEKKKTDPKPQSFCATSFPAIRPHSRQTEEPSSIVCATWCLVSMVSTQQIFVEQERNTIRCQIGTMANAKIHEEEAS